MDDGFFAQHTLVEVNVPEDTDLDIEKALAAPESDLEENLDSLVPSIAQRKSLYFDEALPIYVVIRVPREDEHALKSRIPRLNVSLEAQAVNDPAANAPSASKDDAPQFDTIWSGKLDPTEEPIVVMEESADADDVSTALLLWKMTAILHRPRLRLTAPTIYWKVVGFLDPPLPATVDQNSKYLSSGVPLPMNLLGSFSSSRAFDGKTPFLSAARLAKARPPDPSISLQPIGLKVLPKSAFRALPALTSRIRFHKSHKMGDVPTIAASLELDVPPSAPAEIDLISVELDLARGNVEMMAPEYSIKLPKTCRPRDSLVWLYTFSPLRAFDDPIANALSTHLLQVSITARAHVSDTCKPVANIKWRTSVDFNTALDTVRKVLDPIVQARPAERSGSQARPHSAGKVFSPRQSVEIQHGPDNPEFTVTIAPPEGHEDGTYYVGEPFKWKVIVVNRTAKPAHLALTAIQKRRPQGGAGSVHANIGRKGHSHQSSTGSVTAVSKSGAVAEPVVDENLLYAAVKSGGPEVAQLVCLSSDVKVGPLAAGAAGQAELEFLPMVKGWLQPEAIRLTDMTTSDHCDVRHFPDLWAVERGEETDGETKEDEEEIQIKEPAERKLV